MDILAARKKAAELARTGKTQEPVPPVPAHPEEQARIAGEQSLQDEPAFPPLPDTAFQPGERLGAPEPEQQTAGQAAERVAASAPVAAPEQEAEREPGSRRQAAAPASDDIVESREEDALPEQPLEMLAFLLGREEYVVPVEQVREILRPKEITPVPHTVEHMLGVCSLRGAVMPVIDLNRRLGLPASGRDERSRIIVVSLGPDDRVGLFVDRVQRVVRFLPSAVRPAPETVAQGAGAEYLRGITRKDDRLYILLDVAKAVGS